MNETGALTAIFDMAYVVALAAWIGLLLASHIAARAAARHRPSRPQTDSAARDQRSTWAATAGAAALAAFTCATLAAPARRGWLAILQIGLLLTALLSTLWHANRTPDRPHRSRVRVDRPVLVVLIVLIALHFQRQARSPRDLPPARPATDPTKL